ncbi:tetraacyldisaccharide 4'-kinase [Neisseria chenwenguii]|uniref:Tetraacyldisaccharide 4'-kinase n=1 Tax=Neisseria chenwenguii TaxID=1853278 RepID=A0A220S010_9NEIS|nr:tetraacyldisaccharide 4'-kinase [Neisseria chenwenguii]ASK26777.1 tetraacyldisaccharide 4'-kinase [Neisseria chenwenguii]ROV56440.1 tetraacyldisaccharide 4'-kinase [Neisseria chenwenguii]
MPKLHQIAERHWQRPYPLLSFLLKPFSWLFGRVAAKRRGNFLAGRLKSERLPVPVVVVGNIHAGGVGKTPVVSALVSGLQARGLRAGIVSRGYGRKGGGVCVLTAQTAADEAGDEPLLLFRQTGAPTAVGSRRAEAGRALLAAFPDLDVIVADDGLQHYALRRDVEIAVFPAADTGRRDLDLLPNGGLREPLARLGSVDAVVVSGGRELADAAFRPAENMFYSRVEVGEIYRLQNRAEKLDSGRLNGLRVAAVAGIAKPERFFETLKNMGIPLAQTVSLPDHVAVSAADFPAADVVVVTEKDAVKFSDGTGLENVWVLPVCAIIEPDLADFVIGRLNITARKT